MAIKPFGEPVTFEDVELLRVRKHPRDFSVLCHAIVTAATNRIPEIREELGVHDQGIDASVPPAAALLTRESLSSSGDRQEVADGDDESRIGPTVWVPPGTPVDSILLTPGWNYFQFKFVSITRDRRSALSALEGEIRAKLPDLRHSMTESRYVLMTNLNLRGSDRQRLRTVFANVTAGARRLAFEMFGASEIAAYLNAHPDLRHLFFATGGLATLNTAEKELKRLYAQSPKWPAFVGRSQLLEGIRSSAGAGPGLTLVSGPPYGGKTRLVIEALRPQAGRVRWVSDAGAPRLDLLRDLDQADDIILVVDGCTESQIDRLGRWAMAMSNLRTVLIGTQRTVYPGASSVRVEEMSSEEMDGVLAALDPRAPPLTRLWIKRVACGLPGLALYAASLSRANPTRSGDEPTFETFLQAIQTTFLRGVSPEQKRVLQALSLLPHVSIDKAEDATLRRVGELIGITPAEVRQAIDDLESERLLREKDGAIEVFPTIVGDVLARDLYQREPRLFEKALIEIPSMIDGLFERLRRLPVRPPALERSLGHFLGQSGPFRDIASLGGQIERFSQVLPAAPRDALHALERILASVTSEDLASAFYGNRYHFLRMTLSYLAETPETFEGALNLLGRLALIEAQGGARGDLRAAFTRTFAFLNPRTSVPLAARADFLKRLSVDSSPQRRSLAVAAAGKAIALEPFVLPETVEGPGLPPASAFPRTYQEIRDWISRILALLCDSLTDLDANVRNLSRSQVRERFSDIVCVAVDRDDDHELAGRAFEALRLCFMGAASVAESNAILSEVQRLKWRLQNPEHDWPGVTLNEQRLTSWLLRIEGFERDHLIGSDWSKRLRRHAGPRVFGRWLLGPGASEREAAERRAEAEDLVRQALATQGLLEQDLEWLLLPEAEGCGEFFRALGRLDSGARPWRERLLEHLGDPLGPEAFGFYVDEWASLGPAEADHAEEYLDRISRERPDAALPVISASLRRPPTMRSAERLVRAARCVPRRLRDVVFWITWGSWRSCLAPSNSESGLILERLILGLDDDNDTSALPLVILLSEAVENGVSLTPPTRDRTWRLLERSAIGFSSVDTMAADRWDVLASKIGHEDPSRMALIVAGILAGEGSHAGWPGPHELSRVIALLQNPEHRAIFVQTFLSAMSRATLRFLSLFDPACKILQPDRDANSFIQWVQANGPEAGARVVRLFRGGGVGFLDFACRLLLATGGHTRLMEALTACVTSIGSYTGSPIPRLERRREEIREEMGRQTNELALAWLRSVEEALSSMIDQRARSIWDTEMSVSELEEILRAREAPLRRWALMRVLDDAPPDDASRMIQAGLISFTDIQSILDEETLTPRARRRWKAFLESQSPVR